MKIYSDTNIILDWFRNIMVSAKRLEEFKVPKKLEFMASQPLELTVSDNKGRNIPVSKVGLGCKQRKYRGNVAKVSGKFQNKISDNRKN